MELLAPKKPRRQPKGRIAKRSVQRKQKKRASKQESVMITLLSIYCTDDSEEESQPMYIPASRSSLNET